MRLGLIIDLRIWLIIFPWYLLKPLVEILKFEVKISLYSIEIHCSLSLELVHIYSIKYTVFMNIFKVSDQFQTEFLKYAFFQII